METVIQINETEMTLTRNFAVQRLVPDLLNFYSWPNFK